MFIAASLVSVRQMSEARWTTVKASGPDPAQEGLPGLYQCAPPPKAACVTERSMSKWSLIVERDEEVFCRLRDDAYRPPLGTVPRAARCASIDFVTLSCMFEEEAYVGG